MGTRNSVIRHKRKLNRHSSTLCRRRQKVRWLLAQRARVRSYRRSFDEDDVEGGLQGADCDLQQDTSKENGSE